MPTRAPALVADLAALAAAIERWAADLALAEEPARFLVALAVAAPPRPPASPARVSAP